MKKVIGYFLLAVFALSFFSYKLTQVPRGLTIDESAFGYNSILLSETLHDENNRFLPIFVLSINGKDWRQPVMQYATTAFFKIFGPSVYNLKFVSVIATAISTLLLFFLAKHLLGKLGAALSVLFFITTPIVMIHSHLGLDNIMSIPFTLGWLIFLYLYEKTRLDRTDQSSQVPIKSGRGDPKRLQRLLRRFSPRNDMNVYLALSAISLGIGFYSYKGMRSFVPVWSVLTVIYLVHPFFKSFWNASDKLYLSLRDRISNQKDPIASHSRDSRMTRKTSQDKIPQLKTISKNIKPALIFSISILPFFAIIPFLELKYAGAVLGQANLKIESIYKFLYSYLASFDLSFLFIAGDEMPHHSTGTHGMLLLTSLPFFLTGLYQAVSNNNVILERSDKRDLSRSDRISKFWKLIIIAFFAGPILFGFPGSVHRASRLMALVPLYCLICATGALFLWQSKKVFKVIFAILMAFLVMNSYDFLNYYWFSYADDTYHIFYQTTLGDAYKTLKEESEKRNLVPYVSYEILRKETLSDQGVTDTFLRSIYFPHYPGVWNENKNDFPDNGILMSNQAAIPDLEKLDMGTASYSFYVSEKK